MEVIAEFVVRRVAGGAAQQRRGLVPGAAMAARPAVAPVFGGEEQAETADREAAPVVAEPQVEQRRGQRRIGMDRFPRLAAVAGAQDRRVVPRRPAKARIVHVHSRQQRARRNPRLRPRPTLVVGMKDMAAFADDDEPLAARRRRTVEKQRARGEARLLGPIRRFRRRRGGEKRGKGDSAAQIAGKARRFGRHRRAGVSPASLPAPRVARGGRDARATRAGVPLAAALAAQRRRVKSRAVTATS